MELKERVKLILSNFDAEEGKLELSKKFKLYIKVGDSNCIVHEILINNSKDKPNYILSCTICKTGDKILKSIDDIDDTYYLHRIIESLLWTLEEKIQRICTEEGCRIDELLSSTVLVGLSIEETKYLCENLEEWAENNTRYFS